MQLEGRPLQGKTHKDVATNSIKKTDLHCEIEIDNLEGLLRPGMFARAQINISGAEDRVVIPRHAIQELDSTGQGVVFVVKDGIAMKRRILAGKIESHGVEVLKGLSAGELIILADLDQLKDLDEVAVETVKK